MIGLDENRPFPGDTPPEVPPHQLPVLPPSPSGDVTVNPTVVAPWEQPLPTPYTLPEGGQEPGPAQPEGGTISIFTPWEQPSPMPYTPLPTGAGDPSGVDPLVVPVTSASGGSPVTNPTPDPTTLNPTSEVNPSPGDPVTDRIVSLLTLFKSQQPVISNGSSASPSPSAPETVVLQPSESGGNSSSFLIVLAVLGIVVTIWVAWYVHKHGV